MKRTTIVEAIAILFVILFLYTGISKLMEYDVAVQQLSLSPVLAPFADALIIILPVAEILVAIALFLPWTKKYGLWATLVLMILFTSYVIYILTYNAELPCTCGGVLESLSWPGHLIFNISCLILAVMALLMSTRKNNASIVHE
jgi:uncharacterized membrane protein YphA (DoxX/SURF4 family)